MAPYKARSKFRKKRKMSRTRKSITTTIKNVVNQSRELKGIDEEYSPNPTSNNKTDKIISEMTNSDFIFPVNLINEGPGRYQRIGKMIQLKSFRLSGTINCEWAGTVGARQSRFLRLFLIWDKRPQGLPSKNDIFQLSIFGGTETARPTNFKSMDNADRFSILTEKVYNISPPNHASVGTNANGCTSSRYIDFFKDLKMRKSTYLGTQSGERPKLTDISMGALYVIFLTDITTSGGVNPGHGDLSFTGQHRLRYYDS